MNVAVKHLWCKVAKFVSWRTVRLVLQIFGAYKYVWLFSWPAQPVCGKGTWV